jgi:HK97 family phage major capsid protein
VTMQADLIAKREELATKRAALATLFDEANKQTDPVKRDEVAKNIKSANDELGALVDEIAPLQEMVAAEETNRTALKAMRQSTGRQVEPDSEEVDRNAESSDEVLSTGIKSIHELLAQGLESNGLKSAKFGGRGFYGFRGELGELAIKTLITSADLTPLEQRRPGIVPSAQEERTVADLMLPGTTTAQKLTYFEETTFTNAAVETAEGDPKQESALDFTLREDFVRKIATWVPITDEMMEDVPTFESYLRGRLAFMVKQREELQLLRGAGTGITIQGVYNRTGVQTVTGYGMSTIDSILAAITEVQKDAFVEPTAFVVHPSDWFQIRTSKDLNGNYLLGPATLDPMAARPWGLQVRVTTNALENTGLVGAFNQAQIFRRTGIAIAISTENEDYFIKNKLAVRAEERLALAVYRPAAFCKVEAITTGS